MLPTDGIVENEHLPRNPAAFQFKAEVTAVMVNYDKICNALRNIANGRDLVFFGREEHEPLHLASAGQELPTASRHRRQSAATNRLR